jgi:hypothetical protein
MAKRSREHRQGIPGYNENRPTRNDRKQQHRQVRHSTHQLLHMVDDPDEVAGLPEVRGGGEHDPLNPHPEPKRRRFRVWKTKFWKRRDDYHSMKSEMDSNWPVITPEQLREDRA